MTNEGVTGFKSTHDQSSVFQECVEQSGACTRDPFTFGEDLLGRYRKTIFVDRLTVLLRDNAHANDEQGRNTALCSWK